VQAGDRVDILQFTDALPRARQRGAQIRSEWAFKVCLVVIEPYRRLTFVRFAPQMHICTTGRTLFCPFDP
jgi:hypothetical protein